MALSAEIITEMAACCGLDLAGAVEATPLYYLRQRLEQRCREGRVTAFEEPEINRRIDPKLIWPEVDVYKRQAINSCENMSGGVITAETARIASKAYFQCPCKIRAVISSIRARIQASRGI